jgi:hypothetical protein
MNQQNLSFKIHLFVFLIMTDYEPNWPLADQPDFMFKTTQFHGSRVDHHGSMPSTITTTPHQTQKTIKLTPNPPLLGAKGNDIGRMEGTAAFSDAPAAVQLAKGWRGREQQVGQHGTTGQEGRRVVAVAKGRGSRQGRGQEEAGARH